MIDFRSELRVYEATDVFEKLISEIKNKKVINKILPEILIIIFFPHDESAPKN